jgi:AcrR family transcriptional regulator
MSQTIQSGRTNQKERTRTAILDAARRLVKTDRALSMPVVAAEARVSEATAYRYFPDLATLLYEVVRAEWHTPAEALATVAESDDPVERVAHATQSLLTEVRALQGAVRTLMSLAIAAPHGAVKRPGRRFGLIDLALQPVTDTVAAAHAPIIEQLKRDLAVVMSAEAYFTLTDVCGLAPDEAIASVVQTARTVTRAAVQELTGG